MIDGENIDEPFDLKIAHQLMDEGFCIRHVDWNDYEYAFKHEGIFYDENENDMVPSDLSEGKNYELFREESCETTDESGAKETGEHQNKSSFENSEIETEKEVNPINKESEIDMQTMQNSENNQLAGASYTTKKIKSDTTIEESNGQEIIKTGNSQLSESSTPTIEGDASRRFTRQEIVETPSLDLIDPSRNMNLATSQSMSLIDDSANHLFDLMKSLAPNPKKELYTSGVVEMSVKTAKELREIMKLKLDTLKFAQELKEGK